MLEHNVRPYKEKQGISTDIVEMIEGRKDEASKLYQPKVEHHQYRLKNDMPEFFKINDQVNSDRNKKIIDKTEILEAPTMLSLISGCQGWITVTPRRKNRARPIEKQRLGDASKVNVLSPVWMQVQHKKPGPDPLSPTCFLSGPRKETNRTFLVEKQQPSRSVWDIGSMRHDLHSKELTNKYQKEYIDSGTVVT